MSYQKVYMNQVHSSTLLSQLAQMWKSQLLCDAIIKTGTVTTKAHRLVLVAACPMLQSMENASVGSHLEVRLAAEIKQDSVNTFLQYLYEGFMMLTEENVRDVEKVARLLQVESIITCCSDFDKCLRAKNGSLPPNAPYKYNFADLVEFRHVRTTDLQKTVQERMIKRAAEMSRPSSPGNKRQRMHKPSSDSHSDSYIGANRTDDSLSMSQSYMSGGSGSGGGSQWDRVPRIGTSRPGRDSHHMPGVIDIVDDSIELVQTEPPEKGGGKIDSKSVQKSVSVSISSQISATDVQVVNVTDSDTSSKPSVTPTPSSSSSRGSITVSPLTIFDSPAGRDTSTNKSQDSKKDESRQTDTGQSQRSDSYLSQRSDSHIPQRPDNHQSQRSPFPISLSSVQGSGQSKQFGPSGGQAKPFAAGSATQASYSHSSPVSSAPSTSSPASHSINRNENLERASPAEKSKSNLKHKEPPESSTADMTPDLSIVKIESRNAEIDTGGLDMYVDMPEHGVMQLHRRSDDDQGEHSDIEYEEPSGDWSREDMSNEGSNISGDQNNSWYVGTFKGIPREKEYNQKLSSAIANINKLLAAKMPGKKKKPGPKARVVGMLLYLLPEGSDLPKLTKMDPLIQIHQDQGFGYPSACYNNNLTSRRYPMDINLKGEEMKATIRSLYGTTLLDKDFDLFTVSSDKKLSPAPFSARHFRESRYQGRIIIMIKKDTNASCVNNTVSNIPSIVTDTNQSVYRAIQPVPATVSNQSDVSPFQFVPATMSNQSDVSPFQLVPATASNQLNVSAFQLVPVTPSNQSDYSIFQSVPVSASKQLDYTVLQSISATESNQPYLDPDAPVVKIETDIDDFNSEQTETMQNTGPTDLANVSDPSNCDVIYKYRHQS